MNEEDIKMDGKIGLFCISLIEENQALQKKLDAAIEDRDFQQQVRASQAAMISDLRAKVKELEGKGWLPIESAPKTGRYLGIIIGKSYTGQYFAGEPFICEYDEEEGHICLHQADLKSHKPTHWMPLPEAPKQFNKEFEEISNDK